jgi:hypothetical protein
MTYSRVPGNCKRTETWRDDIQVVIKYLTNTFTLIVCKEDTFQKIKITIQKRFNLPHAEFNVIYNDVIVNSLRKLEDYCIDTKNTRYTLTVRDH